MQIGMMGLGRMGANMVRRLMRDKHECVVYDINAGAVADLVKEGAVGGASLEEFVGKLSKPRSVWLMLPAAITGRIVEQVAALMEPGDIIIDGGNSNYRDAVDQAAKLATRGISYVDVGTSGGIWGFERGYCLMIGGPDAAVKHLDPVFATLAPGADTTSPALAEGTASLGYLHCGPSGAGHFVKMVHNGIEYGVMAAYAEGINILRVGQCRQAPAQRRRRDEPAVGAAILPVRHRPAGGHRSVAARLGHRLVAARPDGRRAEGRPDARQISAAASRIPAKAAGR